jgi:hypothetical protein
MMLLLLSSWTLTELSEIEKVASDGYSTTLTLTGMPSKVVE